MRLKLHSHKISRDKSQIVLRYNEYRGTNHKNLISRMAAHGGYTSASNQRVASSIAIHQIHRMDIGYNATPSASGERWYFIYDSIPFTSYPFSMHNNTINNAPHIERTGQWLLAFCRHRTEHAHEFHHTCEHIWLLVAKYILYVISDNPGRVL